MKNIPGTNLAVVDGEIYSIRFKRKRKPGKREVFAYYDKNGKRLSATKAKLMWCAEHGIEPWKVPRKFSFHLNDGNIVCETIGDRMSRVKNTPTNRVQWQDYEFIEKFAKACKANLSGDKDAQAAIFLLLNSKRKELISHAYKTNGGVGKKKAIDLADRAIQAVFEESVSGMKAVPSPVASMKSRIGWYIKKARMEKSQCNDTSRNRL